MTAVRSGEQGICQAVVANNAGTRVVTRALSIDNGDSIP